MPHIFSYRDDRLYSHHTLDPAPRQEDYVMHAHEWMEIYYFLSGHGSYLIEGTSYPLQPRDILIMRSAETHTLTISPDEPYERIAIHFSPALLEQLAPDSHLLRPFLDRPLGQHNCYPASEDPEGRLRAAFSGFSFADIPNVRLNLTARLMLFLTTLQSFYDKDNSFTSFESQSLHGKVVSYVNEHLFEPLSLQFLADTFYRSRSQISRIFQQTTGSSFWEYVTIKRLLAARAMIQRGESAGNACIACGFLDYSSFYRAYRAHFGHAPREDAPHIE
ncbi:MAG: AraC family transcriptional regulator [Ruminococcaceae bacterium]|nr:AraC family transcriptional regulator [Oscillospiraceae bacterium]